MKLVLPLLPLLLHCATPGRHTETYDIVIYGGTPAAVTAAIQARRMNRSVVLIQPERHLGGLTTGGLGATDIGNKGAVGGLARTFYERIHAHYADAAAWVQESREEFLTRAGHGKSADPIAVHTGRQTMWTFEPRVAEALLVDMLETAHVPLRLGEQLATVDKQGTRIASLTTSTGITFRGAQFIDATYEGDLLAAAGVSYHVGREANAQYGETLNGVQTTNARNHQFKNKIDPYVIPGQPGSGLLYGVHAGQPGEEGSGDDRVQAYNFRMTLTDAPGNRLPIGKPAGYDPQRYELLRRYIDSGIFDAIDLNTPMPNRKTDINNKGAFSSDHIGANYDFARADAATRERIYRDHVDYVKGLWYFIQNDPRLPAAVREKAGRWGLCKDEFADSEHWPRALYVREARRMVGEYVMTENDCRANRKAEDPVGLGAYNMYSHNVQRYVKEGAAVNEGNIEVPVRPYPISYRSLLPKRAEATNLLVPVALSSTHIAYGSIRMEPVFMVLGQSAATAAVLALDGKTTLHDLPYGKLRERLVADQQVLEWLVPAGVVHAR